MAVRRARTRGAGGAGVRGVSADRPITNDVRLYRRITEHHLKAAPDVPGGQRITSAAFISSSDGSGVSVNLADTMNDHHIAPEEILRLPPPGLGLAYVTAHQVRTEDLRPQREPLENDPSHGSVMGDLSSSGRRKRLARLAQQQWTIPLDAA